MIVPCVLIGLLRRESAASNVRRRPLQLRHLLGIGTVLACLSAGTVEGATLTIAWDRNPEPDVTGYVLHYGTSPGQYTGSVDVGNQTQFRFTEPDPTRAHFFAVQARNTSGLLSPLSSEISSSVLRLTRGNFDGDGMADLVVYRPSEGMWYIRFSSTSYGTAAMYQWGLKGDVPLSADFDGDYKTDLVVWRPSTGMWYLRFSSTSHNGSANYQWGLKGDVPLSGGLRWRLQDRPRGLAPFDRHVVPALLVNQL